MKRIGLAPNPHKKEAVELASELAGWLKDRGVDVVLSEDVAADIGKPALGMREERLAESELLVVLGGDGTMLRWSRLAAPKGTPMLGINFGQYGFITEVDPEDAKSALAKVLDSDFCVSERVMLRATLTRDDTVMDTYYALNDVVVSKGPLARVLGLQTFVNERLIATYAADGIIVASPTGSTAYSLSAGGPVVYPGVNVLIITPICPHTLNARSLVVPDDEKIQIVGQCSQEDGATMMLTIDGQLGENLAFGDKVNVGKADFAAKLVQINRESFYDKLQTRLRWGERFSM